VRVHLTFDVPAEMRALLRGFRPGPLASADGAITLLTDRVDAAFFDRAPRLRVVAQMAVGTNNIDLRKAARRGIAVTNAPDVLTDTTAECAIALLFACARGIVRWDRHVRAGRFRGWEPFGYLGTDLAGSTLGIVGRGRIGQAVAARARALGMKVVFATRRGGLDRALACDFVSLHCPLTPATRHLIDGRALRRMKPAAFLVNTARGAVVDEAALVEALRRGRIAGAGLDVYEREPAVHPGLLRRDDVVLLPHIASATHRTRERMFALAVENLRCALAGRRPPNLVR